MLAPILSEAMTSLVQRALNSERGIRIQFPEKGAAINWRQRYYRVRDGVVKKDPASEWRTLTCVIEEEGGKVWVKLLPSDAQLLDYVIEEL